MKKYVVMDIIDIIFIPVITYLLLGLLLIQLCALQVDVTRFVMWGVMAGIILAIQKWFSNKAVTMGIIVYGLAMVLWFAFFVKTGGVQNALFICISFAAILAFVFVMKKRLAKVVAGYGVMGIMIYFSLINVEFSKILIGFAIILFLNSISETIALFYSGNVKSLILIYVMVAMVSIFMPVSKEPYDWAFVFKIIDSVERIVDCIVTEINYQMAGAGLDGIFHFAGTGYSSSEMDLSSAVMEQDVEQLVLKGSYTKRNLYLKGNVCNEYVGNSWKTNLGEEMVDYRVDTLMTLYAIFQETEELSELSRFMEIKEQKVIQQNIKTQSLFYPIKILDISVEDAVSEGDFLRASQVNGRGYSYSYTFVDIDYANKKIIDILRNSSEIIYEEEAYNRIYTNLKEIYGVELEKIAFNEFCEQAEKSREISQKQYINPGNTVSEKIKELAEKTTEDCESEYEISKALERYLYQYNYNKAIDMPENVNALEWFLFEGKEGYCVHYATALAVMLRCKGVPSRVAEGFLVDYKSRIDSYTYSISSNKAHAWVEAYIDGFGWIRLEPTVVNAGNANIVWYSDVAVEEEEILQEEKAEELITEQKEKEHLKISWILMIKLLGGMVAIVAVILAGLLIYRKMSIRRSNNPDVVFVYLISVLEKRYFPKKPSETLSEYFRRLKSDADISEDIHAMLSEIQTSMEMYWYGSKNMSQEDIVRMKELSRM